MVLSIQTRVCVSPQLLKASQSRKPVCGLGMHGAPSEPRQATASQAVCLWGLWRSQKAQREGSLLLQGEQALETLNKVLQQEVSRKFQTCLENSSGQGLQAAMKGQPQALHIVGFTAAIFTANCGPGHSTLQEGQIVQGTPFLQLHIQKNKPGIICIREKMQLASFADLFFWCGIVFLGVKVL